MKPHVVCLMLSSLDGRLHPSRYSASPDGSRRDWSAAYEQAHAALAVDAWLVGRTTMAEMSKAAAHPPAAPGPVDRRLHVAARAACYAIAADRTGTLHFDGGSLQGDPLILLLGAQVSDAHLAELAADGISYIVADGDEIDFAAAFALLAREFGIARLAIEGGGTINGALLAAGLIDELHLLVAPALDGGSDVAGIATYGDGLAGKTRLSLLGAETRPHGIVLLRYAVSAG